MKVVNHARQRTGAPAGGVAVEGVPATSGPVGAEYIPAQQSPADDTIVGGVVIPAKPTVIHHGHPPAGAAGGGNHTAAAHRAIHPIPAQADITVNDVTIAAEAIASEAQNHPAPRGNPGWALQAAAKALVMRELLLQEAAACGIVPDPIELEAGKLETNEEALIRQLLDQAIAPATIDDAQLRAVYDAAPERFHGPSLFEAAHILFPAPADDPAARAAARERATAVLDILRQKPDSFASLAAEHSACPSRANGGMLGQLASGDTVPEFEVVLGTMEEGSIADTPVETRYGVHLIRLDARIRGTLLPFDTVLPQLRAAHEKANWVRASRAYIESLAARAKITGIDLAQTPQEKATAPA
ncbi:peptidase [Pusillimonas sp. TS35]|uniref:peptidylprolyl isomerase n=1 Tax=Paracandidimonas lactea TaxID=2895524 RepID=UPI00136B9A25|nr:peptidylprolyl isomerase [Paracandidimonas lactea]MYN13093.1 peptidase [Pusillimonas sp. TS35]